MARVTPETELAAPVPVQGQVLQEPQVMTVQVPPGAAAGTVMDKANAVAAGLLIDYMFFEIDHGLCRVENNSIKCTLFLCYVAGCLCPCDICCPLGEQRGGGRPPQPETSVGAPTAPDAQPRAAPRAQLLPAMRAHKMEHRD